jgi:mRNA interferase MazF
MPSTTSFEFGDIVLAPFPFTDQRASKKRPAVVVSSAVYNATRPDLIVLAITSQSRPTKGVGEAAVRHWRTACLLKPSVSKPLLATLEQALVLRRLGKLAPADRAALDDMLRLII